MENVIDTLSFGLKGYLKWEVINPDGSVSQSGEHKNLILNQGLDQVATYYFASLTAYCAVGTDNTAPAVTDVGLGVESARTNNLITTPTGATGSTWPNAYTCEFKRTFQFAAGALNGTYYEAGFSPLAAAGNNLFSRVLFQSSGTPTGVTVTSVQELRVVYTLSVALGPNTSTSSSASITGIGTVNFNHAIQDTTYNQTGRDYLDTTALKGLTSSGGIPDPDGYGTDPTLDIYEGGLEPARTSCNSAYNGIPVFVSETATALATVGRCANRSQAGIKCPTVASYSNGNYYIDRSVTFSTNEANSSNINSIGIGREVDGSSVTHRHSYALVLTSPIEKLNTHNLTLNFRISWARV